ncbi:MAG: class I SAM-dependent methyltransferase [Sulfuricella sp.]
MTENDSRDRGDIAVLRNGYRGRIYSRYNSARQNSTSLLGISDLKSRAPYLRRLIRVHFPSNKLARILDLGCGHGALIHFLREAGYLNVNGVDGSSEQIDLAKALEIEGVSEGDLWEELGRRDDASLDVIVSFDVIEHFARDELIPFVDSVFRVLKPSGVWIIHVPNGESPLFGSIRYGDLTHEMAFTRRSISQLLLSSDFARVNSYEDAPVPHGLKSIVRWVVWKVFRSMLRLYVMVETGDSGASYIFSQNMLVVAVK